MSTVVELYNPYLKEFLIVAESRDSLTGNYRAINSLISYSERQERLRRRMAWAVPTDEAIAVIAQLQMPVVEIGAGTGYWAWLLEQVGVDVLAYDINPGEDNEWCAAEHFTTVREGGVEVADEHLDRALMLCWPPYSEPMASDCLERYRGDVLIYIGESWGGCTADEKFFELLDDGWNEERDVQIPQWRGIHDYLAIYRRKP